MNQLAKQTSELLTEALPSDYLRKQHQCPHCKRELTDAEIVRLMHGSGHARYVSVRVRNTGTVGLQEVGQVNPVAVEVLP